MLAIGDDNTHRCLALPSTKHVWNGHRHEKKRFFTKLSWAWLSVLISAWSRLVHIYTLFYIYTVILYKLQRWQCLMNSKLYSKLFGYLYIFRFTMICLGINSIIAYLIQDHANSRHKSSAKMFPRTQFTVWYAITMQRILVREHRQILC